jgi:hypothetical protein
MWAGFPYASPTRKGRGLVRQARQVTGVIKGLLPSFYLRGEQVRPLYRGKIMAESMRTSGVDPRIPACPRSSTHLEPLH